MILSSKPMGEKDMLILLNEEKTMNERNLSVFTARAEGVVSRGNTVEIPDYWHPVFQHLKITTITIAPLYRDIPRLIAYKKISGKILQTSIIEIKKYFDDHFLFSTELQLNDLKKMLRESMNVDIGEQITFEIPKEIIRKAGIRKNIIFIGILSHFEIWDPVYLSKAKTHALDELRRLIKC